MHYATRAAATFRAPAAAQVQFATSEVAVNGDPPNGSHAKLCGQGPRAEAEAARRLPARSWAQRLANCNRRDAVMLAMNEGLQSRADAGPHQLQREVGRPDRHSAFQRLQLTEELCSLLLVFVFRDEALLKQLIELSQTVFDRLCFGWSSRS